VPPLLGAPPPGNPQCGRRRLRRRSPIGIVSPTPEMALAGLVSGGGGDGGAAWTVGPRPTGRAKTSRRQSAQPSVRWARTMSAPTSSSSPEAYFGRSARSSSCVTGRRSIATAVPGAQGVSRQMLCSLHQVARGPSQSVSNDRFSMLFTLAPRTALGIYGAPSCGTVRFATRRDGPSN
jgi:hypothetical protein